MVFKEVGSNFKKKYQILNFLPVIFYIFSSPDPLGQRVRWAIAITWHPSSIRKHFNLLLENHWSHKWTQVSDYRLLGAS